MKELVLSIAAERIKARRRYLWLIPVIAVLFYTIYFYAAVVLRSDGGEAWDKIFYNLYIMNTLFMPTLIAVLAVRMVDAEHSGNTLKQLFTIQPRWSLFCGKLISGAFIIIFTAVSQTAAVFVVCGGVMSGSPLAADIVRYTVDTVCISVALFILQTELSLLFVNQAIPAITAIAGSFVGFMTLLLPVSPLYLLNPWSLYSSLSFVLIDWNSKTGEVAYTHGAIIPNAWLGVLIWSVLFIAAGAALVKRLGDEGRTRRQVRAGGVRLLARRSSGRGISRLPAELLKLYHAPVWIAFFILPLIAVGFGSFNYAMNKEVLNSLWYSLWTQDTLFLCMLFMPILTSVFNAWLWRLERNGNLGIILTRVSAARAVAGKLIVSVLFSSLSLIWTVILYLISGRLAGIGVYPPPELADWLVQGMIGTAAMSAFYLALALILNSFAFTIGTALVLSIGGEFAAARYGWLVYVLPNMMMAHGLRANNTEWLIDRPLHIAASAICVITCFAACTLVLNRRDA